jgi:hypothetical protein
MSARPSLLMEQLGSHWTDFREISHWCIFRKSVEKFQISLMPDKNNGYSTVGSRVRTFMGIFPCILLRIKIFETEVVETIKIHFMLYNSLPPPRKSCRL